MYEPISPGQPTANEPSSLSPRPGSTRPSVPDVDINQFSDLLDTPSHNPEQHQQQQHQQQQLQQQLRMQQLQQQRWPQQQRSPGSQLGEAGQQQQQQQPQQVQRGYAEIFRSDPLGIDEERQIIRESNPDWHQTLALTQAEIDFHNEERLKHQRRLYALSKQLTQLEGSPPKRFATEPTPSPSQSLAQSLANQTGITITMGTDKNQVVYNPTLRTWMPKLMTATRPSRRGRIFRQWERRHHHRRRQQQHRQ